MRVEAACGGTWGSLCGLQRAGRHQSCRRHQCARRTGIVLASVAYEAGIISAAFYTTLVLVAVLTSQTAGAWLEFVLRRGWPLLSGDPTATATVPSVEREPGKLVA